MLFNFDKYNNAYVDTQNTSYDYSSVRHYETDAFSSNDLPMALIFSFISSKYKRVLTSRFSKRQEQQ
jgi:hypothetical protein